MKEIKRIPIPEAVSLELERLRYEADGWRNLVLAAERAKAEDASYERVAGDYMRANIALRLAMEETRKAYIPPEYQTRKYRFEVDYDACELAITEGREDA